MQTSTPAIFRPTAVTPERLGHALTAAYRAAGLTAPDPSAAMRAAILNLPGVTTVGHELAMEAHETTLTPEEFAAHALDRMTAAMAADELRAQINRYAPTAAKARATTDSDQAAADLAKPFAKSVQALQKAAQQLDPRKPMDAETAVARDAGAALTTARAELARLASFAQIHPSHIANGWAGGLAYLVAILAVEGTAVEIRERSYGDDPVTLNEEDLTVTRAVRDLHSKAKHDLDGALLDVARGDVPGVSLHLNTTTQRTRTIVAIDRAFKVDARATGKARRRSMALGI